MSLSLSVSVCMSGCLRVGCERRDTHVLLGAHTVPQVWAALLAPMDIGHCHDKAARGPAWGVEGARAPPSPSLSTEEVGWGPLRRRSVFLCFGSARLALARGAIGAGFLMARKAPANAPR